MRALLVAAAGAAGALARWGLHAAVGTAPWSTVGINVVGSLLLGVLAGVAAGRVPEAVRLAVGTGFLGAFTTFSTFSVDVAGDLDGGRAGRAAAVVAASVILGVAAALLGERLGRLLA